MNKEDLESVKSKVEKYFDTFGDKLTFTKEKDVNTIYDLILYYEKGNK